MSDDNGRYVEAGQNYRFFLGWRYAIFAGVAAVVWAVFSTCKSFYEPGVSPEARGFLWLVPTIAGPFCYLMLFIDRRNRKLYHAATTAGKQLEGENEGFFHRLDEQAVPLPMGFWDFWKQQLVKPLHTLAIILATVGSYLILTVFGFALVWINRDKSDLAKWQYFLLVAGVCLTGIVTLEAFYFWHWRKEIMRRGRFMLAKRLDEGEQIIYEGSVTQLYRLYNRGPGVLLVSADGAEPTGNVQPRTSRDVEGKKIIVRKLKPDQPKTCGWYEVIE